MNNPATNKEGSSLEMRVENDVVRSGEFSPQRLSTPFAPTRVNGPECDTFPLKQGNETIQPVFGNWSQQITSEPAETNFTKLIRLCEQRLLDFIKNSGKALTPERVERISLQAEWMATLIWHRHGLKDILPPEDEMVNISMRAKYEVNRLPEIQKDLMVEGEENVFRAYRIAERLASIEGRLTYEAMKQGVEPPLHLSYVAKKELERHRERLPHLTEEMKGKYVLSNVAAQHCALDILRYKETHGENPSSAQMEKMVEISRQLENKEYNYRSRDSAETEFLRRRESDLLFRHGLSYDAPQDLDRSQAQVEKSLRDIQRQMEQDRQHSKQMEMGL